MYGLLGSNEMVVAILVWLITLVTTYHFVMRTWWFPESASAHGSLLDGQFETTLLVTGVVFILAQVALGYVVWKYRSRPTSGEVTYSHGNNRLEMASILITTIVFYLMVLPGQSIWADLYINVPEGESVQIEVTGQQFAWNIRYPGADGKFGRIRPDLIDDSSGNPLGLDFDDPAAEDDLVLPTMALPVDQPIELLLRSKDVTHSFFVRELRIKQDTVPGLTIPLRFTPTKIGQYEVACAELCGLGHHTMRSFVEVLSETDYRAWLADMAE